MKKEMDLYSDYLLSSFGQVTATGLSNLPEALRVPVAFECVKKTVRFCDVKTRKEKQQSPVSKNEMMRTMMKQVAESQHLKFRYVPADSWFSSSDSLLLIHRMKKYFIIDMKSNCLSMSSTQDRNRGQRTGLDKLPLQPGPAKVWIKDSEIEVLLCKFAFTDKGGSMGKMYPVSNELELFADCFKTLYRKRWSAEEYHNFLKQNASLLACIKPERLKFVHRLNHFALKSILEH